MEQEKDESRQQLMAIAFVLGFEPGDARRPWPGFIEKLGRGDDDRPYRRWLSGASCPAKATLRDAAARLKIIGAERGSEFDPAWLHLRAEDIVLARGRSIADFRRAFNKATAAELTPTIAAPFATYADDYVSYTAKRYYRAYHLFRYDEMQDEKILHGVVAIGPDEPTAPGVPRVALLEKHLFYRGFAFTTREEILATLHGADAASPGCCLLIERHRPSENAYAGIFTALAHKRSIPISTRCALVRMRTAQTLCATSAREVFESVLAATPHVLDPGHADYGLLAGILQQPQRRRDALISRHAISMNGEAVAERLRDFRPFATVGDGDGG